MRIKTRPRTAYIDGGLALFLFQAAIAGVLGIAWTIKSYWFRIKAWFGGVPAQPDTAPATDRESSS